MQRVFIQTVLNNDIVTCILTSSDVCASPTTATSNAVTISVNTSVTPLLNISASSTTICSGTLVNFTATPSNGGSTPSYQWKLNGANIGSSSATYSSSSLNNNDIVTCVMTSSDVCASPTTATSNAVTMSVNGVVDGVSVSSITSTSASVSWNAISYPGTGWYELQYENVTDNPGVWNNVGSIANSITTYNLTNLLPNKNYNVQVKVGIVIHIFHKPDGYSLTFHDTSPTNGLCFSVISCRCNN
ncbi:MAG: fibronectin type III domain-containing protein [Chitinophagaceae bacterium]